MTEHGSSVIEISQELFDEIYPDQDSHQISVYIRDYAYMDRVLKKIEGAGYQAVPSGQEVRTITRIRCSSRRDGCCSPLEHW